MSSVEKWAAMLRPWCACLLLLSAAMPVHADDVVVSLRRESRTAFGRGLLSVADFLEQQSAALELRLQRLPVGADPSNIAKTLLPRLDDLRWAVAEYERFQQPAAADWAADLALLRYTLSRAETDAAVVTGQKSAALALTKSEAHWAWEHYRRRVFDARVLGHASLPKEMEAAALLNLNPALERSLRTTEVQVTSRWADLGAEIGRQDRVLDAELGLLRFTARPTGKRPTDPQMQAFVDADQLTARLFAGTLEFHRHGTATLADVARTWRLRQTLHEQAIEAGFAMRFASKPAMLADLETLTDLAQQTTDHRGRVASDVLYVQLIGELQARR